MRNAIRSSYASLLMPHCPVTVVERYRDGVCSLLFHFFIICHPYIPLHLEEMIFRLVLPIFGRTIKVQKRDFYMQLLFPSLIGHHC